ncbi:replication initiator protein A [Cupriavidus alkaliphilus]|uniref:replication initiator protein A n=1 Tax=Cupriavidus alkaliphilus TaxID=942866 RepID=UPI00339D74AD
MALTNNSERAGGSTSGSCVGRPRSGSPSDGLSPTQLDLLVLPRSVGCGLKDDLASMEIPLFSLAKQKDVQTREYRRGNKTIRVIPSSVGAATVFDKDLLLYVASQIVEALNKGKQVSRTVQIDSIDFLLSTDRGEGRASYERIIDMLRRLRGTTIETNIPTGGKVQTEGFALIDHYKVLSEKTRTTVVQSPRTGKNEQIEVLRVFSFVVTISEWLYNSLLSFQVLTLDRAYFSLSRSIDRRLYEIARKHCGDQPMWKINIDLLAQKIGTTRERFKIRDEIRDTIEADHLPEYRVALDPRKKPDDVVFYTRDTARLHRELIRANEYHWYQSLERSDNVALWRSSKTGNGTRASAKPRLPAFADADGKYPAGDRGCPDRLSRMVLPAIADTKAREPV